MIIELMFNGKPMSKDNEKIFNKQGKVFLSYKYKKYEADLQKQAYEQLKKYYKMFIMPTKKENIKYVNMAFYFPDERWLDLFNSPKSIGDAMKGILWVDDRIITDGHLHKEVDKDNPRIELIMEIIE